LFGQGRGLGREDGRTGLYISNITVKPLHIAELLNWNKLN